MTPGINILLVSNNNRLLAYSLNLLGKHGFKTHGARDFNSALQILDKQEIELVVILKETEDQEKDYLKNFIDIRHPEIKIIEQNFHTWQLPDMIKKIAGE